MKEYIAVRRHQPVLLDKVKLHRHRHKIGDIRQPKTESIPNLVPQLYDLTLRSQILFTGLRFDATRPNPILSLYDSTPRDRIWSSVCIIRRHATEYASQPAWFDATRPNLVLSLYDSTPCDRIWFSRCKSNTTSRISFTGLRINVTQPNPFLSLYDSTIRDRIWSSVYMIRRHATESGSQSVWFDATRPNLVLSLYDSTPRDRIWFSRCIIKQHFPEFGSQG